MFAKMNIRFWIDESGVGAIEFAFMAPLIGVMFLGIISAWSYMRQDSNMRDAVEAAAKYYVQGGTSDSQAATIVNNAWSAKPDSGTVSTSRMCTCATTPVSCNTGTICSDNSIPQISISVKATSSWTDPYSSNIFPNGLALSESENIRVR